MQRPHLTHGWDDIYELVVVLTLTSVALSLKVTNTRLLFQTVNRRETQNEKKNHQCTYMLVTTTI